MWVSVRRGKAYTNICRAGIGKGREETKRFEFNGSGAGRMRSKWNDTLKNVEKAVSDGIVKGGFGKRSACKEHITISI